MELWYLLEASILSQSLKDPNALYNPIVILFICVYGIYKIFPSSLLRNFDQYMNDLLTYDYYNTSIIIPYHTKLYMGYGSKPVTKTIYSERFCAITHHIKKYHIEKISSLTEILNFENSKYIDINTSEFLMIPKDKQNILISKKYNIFAEVIYDINNENNSDKDDSDKTTNYSVKKYVYKLLTPGLHNMNVMNTFLSEIENEYRKDANGF